MGLLIGNKIKEIRVILDISQNDFAESIGINRATLSIIEIDKQSPTIDHLKSIANIYSIPVDYFLYDDKKLIHFVNDQLKKHKKVVEPYDGITRLSQKEENKQDNSGKFLPLIPVEAIAGLGKGDVQVMDYDIKESYRIPEFNGHADFLIRISGTSMSPKYFNGDLVACKRIEELTFIQWGKVYVMDTMQGPLVKRLYQCTDKKDCIICHSDNTELYPRFEIQKKDIRSISIVIGTIRLD